LLERASGLWRHRRLRIAIVGCLLALPLLLGGWLWFRDSALVSVRRVQISGVQGPDAAEIDASLTRAARHMTTLDVQPGALRAAVARFPVVRALRVSAGFPHDLRIRVLEQLPVAALTVNGRRTAVAADGAVLGPALLSGALPTVAASTTSAARERVRGWQVLAALTVLGVAPAPLLKVVERVFFGPKGLTLAMRNGLLAYFGDATRPHAKWLALASVLIAPGSAGASYVDVRLPERPAAGFAGGAAPEASAASAEAGSASTPATTAELAAGLASGGGGIAAPATGTPGAATGASSPAAAASAPSQAEPPAGSQAPAGSSPATPAGETSAGASSQAAQPSPQEPASSAAQGG
jgi:cell division protein FtsQ